MVEVLYFLLFFCLYGLILFGVSKYLLNVHYRYSWTALNFEGKPIIHGFGLAFIIHYFLFLLLTFVVNVNLWEDKLYILTDGINQTIFLFTVFIFGLGCLGWIDDFQGNTEIKGLKGHFRAFFVERKITSGLLKAIGGTLLSIYVSFSMFQGQIIEGIVSSLLLIFSIHLFNLLDVRPSRCIKSFWLFLALFVLPFVVNVPTIMFTYIFPILLSTSLLFHLDRRRIIMLGDTGSNVLGGVYGFLVISYTPIGVQWFVLILFAMLGLISEKFSFTRYINNSPWLSKIDRWGVS